MIHLQSLVQNLKRHSELAVVVVYSYSSQDRNESGVYGVFVVILKTLFMGTSNERSPAIWDWIIVLPGGFWPSGAPGVINPLEQGRINLRARWARAQGPAPMGGPAPR